MTRTRVAVLLALALLAGGCDKRLDHSAGPDVPPTPTSTMPDLAPGERPARGTEEAGIWSHVDNAEAGVRTAGNVVRDPELTGYVRDIVCRLASEYCPHMRVYILREPVFNAAVYPTGLVVVHTGLLVRVRNEAQLASIIGHEIAHYVRRHGLERARDRRDLFGLATMAAFAPLGLGPLIQDIAIGSYFSFSRDNEREADSLGLRLIDRAGYDPSEAPKVWEYVQRESGTYFVTPLQAFQATHPSDAERQETLALRAKAALAAKPGARETGADRFRRIMLPRRGEYIRDLLRVAEFDEARVLLRTLLEDDPHPGELRFYQGELHRIRGWKDDRAAAIGLYRRALSEPGCPPEANRALGQALLASGNKPEAETAFRAYLDARPDAPDRDVILTLLQ